MRDWGATGQQQHACIDSEELAVRGGAGGFFFSTGGGTKPFSSDPSPAQRTVPLQSVAARAVLSIFLAELFFIRASAYNEVHSGAMNALGKVCFFTTVLPALLLWISFPPGPVLAQADKEYGADIYWNATPNDVNNLLRTMAEQTDAHYQMEVKDLREISTDPEHNPVLYRSGHYLFEYTESERAKLREYLLAGGMIVYNTGLGSAPFYRSVVAELKKIFPEQPLQRLTSDHPIFHAYYDVDQVEYTPAVQKAGFAGNEPWFDAIEINCRVVALVSRWGLAVGWQGEVRDEYQAYKPLSAQRLGMNILTYASVMRAWSKNAAQSMRFVDEKSNPGDQVSVAQIMYDGAWKTRHAGLSVLLQTFNRKTGVPVTFGHKELRLTDPSVFDSPLLYLTGHEYFTLSEKEQANLRLYLENGGFLFAEACCGRKGFDLAFRNAMKSVLPGGQLEHIPTTDTLFLEPNQISSVGVTAAMMERDGAAVIAPRLLGIEIDGQYGVIYSQLGLAGGWEMSQSPYARGFSDIGSIQLGQNVLMYAITH